MAGESGGAFYSRAQPEQTVRTCNPGTSTTILAQSPKASTACTGGTLLVRDSTVQHNTATSFGGAYAFWSWPNQMEEVMDTNTAHKLLHNAAAGGGAAALLRRSDATQSPLLNLSLSEYLLKLAPNGAVPDNLASCSGVIWSMEQTVERLALMSTERVAAELAKMTQAERSLVQSAMGLLRGVAPSCTYTKFGPKIAGLGSEFEIVQDDARFQYSAGQMENPDFVQDWITMDPFTGQQITEPGPGRLKLITTLYDAFRQRVMTANTPVCFVEATVNSSITNLPMINEFTSRPLLIGSGTVKMPLSAGQVNNSNLRLMGYIKPNDKIGGTDIIEWAKENADVKVDCYEALDWAKGVEAGQRRIQTVASVETPVGDCPKGWYPIYNRDVPKSTSCPGLPDSGPGFCEVVQMCAPCFPGFFSSQLNTGCMNCPSGAMSEEGAFGIRQCGCSPGKYIEYYQYSKSPFIPPTDPKSSKDMKCKPCPTGGTCKLDDISTYPYPLAGYWQPEVEYYYERVPFKGMYLTVPIDLGPKSLYECPYESCNGGVASNCSIGYMGHVCGICENNYKPTIDGCEICKDGYRNIFVLLAMAAIATPFIILTTLLGLWVSAATSKIDLIREIKRVYGAINYRNKPCIPGKLMWAVYNSMTPEEKSLQGVSAFGDTRMVEFINMLLQNKPAVDLTPDDVDEISERLECWDHAQAAVAEKRVQKAIARALAQYQNYMLTAEMVRRNEELQQNGDVEEEEQENVTVEEVLMDNRADITSQTQDQADSNADAINGDDEGDDEDEEEEEEEEEGDLIDDLADTEGMLDDAAGEMEEDTGADEGDDSDPMEDLSAQLKIVTSHFQVLGGGGKSLGLKWPGTAAGLMKLANYFNIDVFAIFSIDCMERYNYYDKLHAFLFVPIFFVLMMLTIYFILKLTTSIDLDMIKNFAWSKFIILMFLLYPILCTQLLGVFDCREIDGNYWLKKDLTIECYTDEWTSEAIMSAVFIVIFPLGVPAAVYFVLSRNRHRLNIDAKFKSRLGFIYSRYEEWFWFWEVRLAACFVLFDNIIVSLVGACLICYVCLGDGDAAQVHHLWFDDFHLAWDNAAALLFHPHWGILPKHSFQVPAI